MAAQAFKIKDNDVSRSNLLRVLQAKDHKKVPKAFLYGHSRGGVGIAISPDGKTLASGSLDNTVHLWDVESRKTLGEPLTGHTKSVYSVAFSADGKTLASSSMDNTVRLWDVNPNSWKKQLCAIANRNLSHKEWQKYIGEDRPHEKTCPDLPTDTLGAIELTQEALELVTEAKELEEENPEEAKAKLAQAKAKFAQAREWDANVVYGD